MDSPDELIEGAAGLNLFSVLVLLAFVLMVVVAWHSTHVVDPVVSSVILVERSPVANRTSNRHDHPMMESAVEHIMHHHGLLGDEEQLVLPDATTNNAHDNHHQQQPQENVQEEETPAVASTSSAPVETEPSTSSESQPPMEGSEEERITVRLKFLNDTHKDVNASLIEKLSNFKQRNFTSELAENKTVRLIFNGKVLKGETKTLQSHGIFNRCVVHCLIQQQAPPDERGGPGADANHLAHALDPEDDFDLSELFIPMLGALLVITWYFAVNYSHYFNFMTTLALAVLTTVYFLIVYGVNFHVQLRVRG